jgi:dTDP-4-amino-4,6-dideoxygalactose transaminase
MSDTIKPNAPILVTQPDLPDLKEFTAQLHNIWESKWLTNNGSFHKAFEKELTEFLGVKHLSLFSNGTIALITALQALEITGEVITTPYSFVATTHALTWNNIIPVFADIDPVYGNMDISKIEALITPKTTAIMPVHVYGNPVDVEGIERIARKHNLKVIYDAAHAFGVSFNGNSILNHGDLSILSFHATKAFNTIEGGAIIAHNPEIKKKIDLLKNFGFVDEITVNASGINGKMNEVIAAYGLLQLKYFHSNNSKRDALAKLYRSLLKDIKGIRVLEPAANVAYNNAYFPVFIEEDFAITRDALYELLKEKNIYGRRYFYPLISNFPIYSHIPTASHKSLPVANVLADQVICLPMFSELKEEEVTYICKMISEI